MLNLRGSFKLPCYENAARRRRCRAHACPQNADLVPAIGLPPESTKADKSRQPRPRIDVASRVAANLQ